MLEQKQLFQVQNILETLTEATDHFSSLIKQKELNQSIYIFSSIVDGSQAVIQILNTEDDHFTNQMAKLEKHLISIAEQLEQGRFIKVSEIIQFSLRPLFVQLEKDFIDELGDQKSEETISIGIFHSWANPRELYPKERLQATLNESMKQNTQLYFFTSTDIDFEKEQIHAETYRHNKWEHVTVPFPDVINNMGAGKRSQAERKLQRIIPFTGFHVGNKFSLPEKMLKNRKFAELLVPFTVCIKEDKVYQFINKNNNVVFKALGSNRGENIYFVTKKGSRYVMLDQKKERILSEDDFHHFVTHTILAEKGSYIIQRYIHTRTQADEPYHFRSHVQKDQNGQWQITHIYPRIGSKKSNLSNISTEGRVEDFPTFLREQYGEKQGSIYEKKILELSIDVATHLDKLYGMALNELGLDFAIDDTGKIWMHEANNGPQTAYHEEKRAINFIAYAKYMAKNGVMHIGQAKIEAAAKGQFQAKNTDLPLADNKTQTCIGVLMGGQSDDELSISLAHIAKENNVPCYSFTPKDIDYDLGLIRGSFYENNQWIQKVAELPSVIIDRLKMRSTRENIVIYEELEDIPFTNEWVPDATSRSTIYKVLPKSEEITKSVTVAAHQAVKRPLHVFQFIEQYGQVLLKQEDMAYAKPVYTISATDDKQYKVLKGSTSKTYSENSLRNFINHLLEENQYIVQEYTAASDTCPQIHSLLMKNEHDRWATVSNHIELKVIKSDNSIEFSEQTVKEFGKKNGAGTNLEKQIEEKSSIIATVLDNEVDKKLSEIAITYAVNKDMTVSLLEVNPNGPKTVYDKELYAEAAVRYAIQLGTLGSN